VSALRDYNATVLGFDVAFSECDPADAEQEDLARRLEKAWIGERVVRRALSGSNDLALAHAMQQQGSTYLGYFFRSHMFHETTGAELASFRTKLIKPPPLAYIMTLKGPGARHKLISPMVIYRRFSL